MPTECTVIDWLCACNNLDIKHLMTICKSKFSSPGLNPPCSNIRLVFYSLGHNTSTSYKYNQSLIKHKNKTHHQTIFFINHYAFHVCDGCTDMDNK